MTPEYVPGRHELQVLEPEFSEYFPATQSIQAELIPELYCPGSQEEHEVAPSLELEPPGQLLHLLAPPSLYVPDEHEVQDAAPELLYLPASQSVQDDEPLLEVVPAPQSKQFDELANALYLPPAQSIQVEAPSPLNLPTSQSEHESRPAMAAIFPLEQSIQTEAPMFPNLPASHSVQESAVASLPAYLPPSQSVQLKDDTELYDPDAQLVHDEASAAEKVPASQDEHPELEQSSPEHVFTLNLPAVHPTQEDEPADVASEPPEQVVQAEEPEFSEYFPTPHIMHSNDPSLG